MNDDDTPPFDEFIKQMQEFLQKFLSQTLGTNIDFKEIMERMKTLAEDLDPDELDEMMKQFGGGAFGFSMSFGENGEPEFKPFQGAFPTEFLNLIKQAQNQAPRPPSGTMNDTVGNTQQLKEPYYEWVELPNNEWELIIQLPGVSEKNIALDITNTSLHVRGESDDLIYESEIDIQGKFPPDKKVNSTFKNGLLIVTTSEKFE